MARTQKLKEQPALPLRCSYLDTEDLMDRLRSIYGSDKAFKLVVRLSAASCQLSGCSTVWSLIILQISNDRYILYAATKLTKVRALTA